MIKNMLLYIWQLPLNIIGKIVKEYLAYRDMVILLHTSKDFYLYAKDTNGDLVLGKYIFISPTTDSDAIFKYVKLSKQSQLLGPFYIIFYLYKCIMNYINNI